ncbi:MAG: penicillin-insensitive murein endopeptidase [Myxococcales bacterium]|nr:penicillin-insensitive murein endopeptidase [Myxococcales bacterium]
MTNRSLGDGGKVAVYRYTRAVLLACLIAMGPNLVSANVWGDGYSIRRPLLCRQAKTDRPEPTQDRSQRIEHVVLPGDTLSGIAVRYGVTVAEVRNWNKLRSDRIYIDRKLIVFSRIPVRVVRELVYIVEPGDTLGGIAAQHKMTVKELSALNQIKNPDKIRPGMSLRVLVEGPEKASEARGKAQYGKLVHGEQLQPGPGYVIKRGDLAYGTNETITLLLKSIAHLHKDKKLKKIRKKIAPIVIGDISKKGGGPLPPHKSHQNGRDVDIGYYYMDGEKSELVRTTKENLDYELTWAFLWHLVESDAVDYMFVDKNVQRWLRDWAVKQKKASVDKIDSIFQYPTLSNPEALIQHEPGHNDHIHIRFRCPSQDRNCW